MAEWDKTQIMNKRISKKNLENEETYQGRHIIHRDSSIDGGVYLGAGEREAIVVDSKKYPLLNELYQKAKYKSMDGKEIRKDKILHAVYDVVKEAMPKQDISEVNSLIKKYGVKKDGKISLDVFLKKGIGVCRHDALACAAILELFKKDGMIRGEISVDRNLDYMSGHAWCRYTNFNGETFILDVAQKYFGRLEKATDKDKWAYQRPDDF